MRHSKPMTFLEPKEVLALLRAAKEHSPRAWAMILLAYRHGLRCSEICGLKLEDLDLKAGQITTRRLKGSMTNVQQLDKVQGQPLLNEPAAIRAYLAVRGEDPSPYLFVSRKGGRLDRSGFFRLFQAIAAEAGLPPAKRHPHVLKHSRASHLVAAETNLSTVRQVLGHMSPSSTARYIHVTDERASQAARRADSILF